MISAVELSKRLGAPFPPTDEQAAVIEAPLTPAVVIAGAGSGKTETMAARVVWLIANGLVAPDAVLGLTFTRKAAAELGVRIRRRLAQWRRVVERDSGDPDAKAMLAAMTAGEPTVLTYAAYAGRLVGEHAARIGAEPDARLVSPAVGWQLADAVSRRYPALPSDIGAPATVPRYVLGISDQLADHLVSPAEVARFCVDTLDWFNQLPFGKGIRSPEPGSTAQFLSALRHRVALLPLVEQFAAAKRARGAVDFADQMRVAAAVARVPAVQQIERGRWAAVLLDEYQDTGHAQVELLRGLFGDGHPVTAVGDPFQSIYGWRGASSGNMTRFARMFPADVGSPAGAAVSASAAGSSEVAGSPAAVFSLATSFRNDERILRAANLVAEPLAATGATLVLRPAPGAGAGIVSVARTETVADEAEWVARQIRSAWDARPPGQRTAAVLVRRRAQIPLLSEALLAQGLPVEIVGLGGLLTTPEVADVVATLRVLARHDAGTALARLLTGARWRIGPRDLAALNARASLLGRQVAAAERPAVQPGLFDGTDTPAPDTTAAVPVRSTPAVPVTIIEALDDLGPGDGYSAEGLRRLTALAGELRRLRRRTAGPLTDLVAEVEHAIGVDIEVAARADRAGVGRAHLDRFLDETAAFADEADEATLSAFLAYLEAAEDEENGLESGEVVVESERVQVLTVHGAKGLEWDIVAVPGLVQKVFPAEPRSIDWTRARQQLPIPLRGDRDDLPPLVLAGAADRKEVRDRLDQHTDHLKQRHQFEERRLAYVALTRARSVLLASGYVWDTAQGARDPSPFLDEVRTVADTPVWFVPEPDAVNPLTAEPRSAQWPLDPFGPYPNDRGPGRRAAVESGASLVRAALDEAAPDPDAGPVPSERAERWHRDISLLLAERQRTQRGDVVDVELPEQLSVSQLVELQRDPDALARGLHRTMPRPPAPWARRGTAFHTWLEQRWGNQVLLDLDELPGAADEGGDAADADFLELREAFSASVWGDRTPTEVEVPFEMSIGTTVIRGRMDAVFGNAEDGWIVVDWKTGRRPTGAAAAAAAVQLAAYRLAWARMSGLPDEQMGTVRAAFHYVRSNETVEPTTLLDAAGLRALIVGDSADANAADKDDARAGSHLPGGRPGLGSSG